MRTITELSQNYGKVYVRMLNKAIQYRFFSDAEREGYVLPNNMKPTEGECYHLMVVYTNKTLRYVSGWAANYHYNSQRDKLITVDYEKYIDGEEDYIVKIDSN